MLFAVIIFPGSNCDHDVYHVAKHVLGRAARYVWHKDRDLRGADVVVLPGGFAYGDYLRTGCIARFSPAMDEVRRFAQRGGHVIGICNGFQILQEARLLPGALLPNASSEFRCEWVNLRVEAARTPFTADCGPGQVLRMPISHGEGNFYADPATLAALEGNGQVVFRYCAADGSLTDEANPNGSLSHIAGICNREGNVLGMMPHPERACEAVLGSSDGLAVFRSAIASLQMVTA